MKTKEEYKAFTEGFMIGLLSSIAVGVLTLLCALVFF